MISMKLVLGIIFGVILLLMLLTIVIAVTSLVTKRYKYTGACIHIIFLMLIILGFTIILINSKYSRHIGGKKHYDLTEIHMLNGECVVELSNGRLINTDKILYGTDTYIVEDTKLIEKCILGFETYTDTNLLIVKPSNIDLDTMSESEKKHYLTNKYIELY